jgi:hypothetical protein
MHQPAYAGQPHRFRDVARAAEIDVEAEAERLLHPRADETRGMHHGIDLVRLDGLDQRGQVTHVLAGERVAFVPELLAQEVRARLRIDEDDRLAARERFLGKGSADQTRAGDECGHRLC